MLPEKEKQWKGDKPAEDKSQGQVEFCPEKNTCYPGTAKINNWHELPS
jgi:hypothetical protein